MKAKVRKKLRSYLNGQSLTQTLSVPSEIAGIIWDYIDSLFTHVLHVMVLDPTCLDLLVKDKETREPFLFCFL